MTISVFIVILSALKITFGLLDIDSLALCNLLSMINLYYTYNAEIIDGTH